MSKRTVKPPEWVRISKYCVNVGCRRIGVWAEKVSDFWVVRCDECRKQEITLDMNKILSERPDGFTPGNAA